MLEFKKMGSGKEKWVKSIRNRLDNYEELVPEGAWEALEQEISSERLPSSWNWKRMVSVAVVVFLVFTTAGVWMLDFSDEQSFQKVANSTKRISDMSKQVEIDAVPLTTILESENTIVTRNDNKNNNAVFTEMDRSLVDSMLILNEVDVSAEAVCVCSDTLSNQKKQANMTVAEKSPKTLFNTTNKYNMSINHVKEKKMNWGIGVMYANSLGVRDNIFPGYSTLDFADFSQVKEPLHDGILPQINKAPQKGPLPTSNKSELPKTEIKHKFPVTAGISFRYYINERFAVETGLNYTMLSSELRAGTHDEYYIEEYKFHYLGIPLKASWTFLDVSYLSLYLSAGGEMEKSLAGKYKKQYVSKDEDIIVWNDNIKPVQWSLLGSLGVQLKINSHVGIYAEPGVVYYFDDGSKVQTIRKEKPFNLKIQLGVRWTY